MEHKKHLIYKEDVVAMAWLDNECEVVTLSDVENLPAADAVTVDEIKFHHLMIDQNGVPELKLQLGERILILHTDPVDVKKVVHGRWLSLEEYAEKIGADATKYSGGWVFCSECEQQMREFYGWNYCPSCGAKMDGDENG